MTKKINYFDYGYVRVSSICPRVYVADPQKNARKIVELAKQQAAQGSLILVYPELCTVGYTTEDLLLHDTIKKGNHEAISFILEASKTIHAFIIIGHPYQVPTGAMYNCASVIFKGKLLAMIPKTFLARDSEFYESRYYTSGKDVNEEIHDFGQSFKLTTEQIVSFNNKVIIGVEICQDLFSSQSPIDAAAQAGNGASILCNLSASPCLVGKQQYRKQLVAQKSATLNAAYVYSSAGSGESSKDLVFDGSLLIYSNGQLKGESKRFSFEDQVITADIDVDMLAHERRKNSTYGECKAPKKFSVIRIEDEYSLDSILAKYPKYPFVPADPVTLAERSEEILEIQSTGLARRMLTLGKPKLVLGLSGGLDSTLALLVCLHAVRKVGQPVSDIHCLSLPGFGSTSRTMSQSEVLGREVGINWKEINISNTVTSHFNDVGHDPQKTNFVYENAQARYRTLILFQVANAVGGFVVGTGDWSEIGNGFCTYGADHLSNYNPNCSVPKTLVQHLIRYYKDNKTDNANLKQVLQDILDTKISPELLPPGKDNEIIQSSEDIVGPYVLTDYFLFLYARHSFSPEKIYLLACESFKDEYDPQTIKKWMDICFDRFEKNQFKRSVAPQGPKVGVSWSPRGDWRGCEK